MRRATWIAGVLLCGCSATLDGSLTVEWQAEDKHVTITPDRCESGERYSFYGVDLWRESDDAAHIRAILDAKDGPFIKLDVPGIEDTLTLVPGAGCETLELTVERQGSSTNDIFHVEGHLRLDCTPPGFVITADIDFTDCH